MAKRSENRNKAYEVWAAAKGNLNLVQIAERVGVSASLIRKWKSQDKWEAKGVTTQKRGAPLGNSNAVGNGAPIGNKNALGNKGGHAPPGNKNALRHGLYAKYLPDETVELIENATDMNPLEMVWQQICIQYAAIIRAQKLMYVKDQNDIIKRQVTFGDSDGFSYKEVFERQEAFMRAQSKAMQTLIKLIDKYDAMLKDGLATEEQQLRISKLRAEVNGLTEKTGDEMVNIGFLRKKEHNQCDK